MPIFPFWGRTAQRAARRILETQPTPQPAPDTPSILTVRRHFYNERTFQTFATFFPLWGGWATAGHCLTEANDLLPPFTSGRVDSWPSGLDAALIGGALPRSAPAKPRRGQRVIAQGFPAGSRHLETRNGAVYLERSPGQWITQLDDPDEPVVTGMSGGPVLDAQSREPLGILITRNSPADLDADSDPDESYDFIALSDVWAALRPGLSV
jgi:hypothetical protein